MKHVTTLTEANEAGLEVTFCATAAEAELHSATLARHGRNVVAVFAETLAGASKPLHLVCVARNKRMEGPLGIKAKL